MYIKDNLPFCIQYPGLPSLKPTYPQCSYIPVFMNKNHKKNNRKELLVLLHVPVNGIISTLIANKMWTCLQKHVCGCQTQGNMPPKICLSMSNSGKIPINFILDL
jgi:hypothetical protein